MKAPAATLGVTGASGQLGSEVLRQLRMLDGERPIVACTRSPNAKDRLRAFTDDIREADFARSESLHQAFEGIDRLLIISVEGPDSTRLAMHRCALEAARRAGVGHIIYASFLDVDPASPSSVASIHRQTEAMIAASGVGFTALRNGPYLENMVGRIAAAAMADGVLRWSAGAAGLPFITRRDLAAGAASALAGNDTPKRPLVLAGPALVGFAELCAMVEDRTGRKVRYESVDDDTFGIECRRQGLTEEYVERRVAYGMAMRKGFMSILSTDFEKLVGRPPESVAAGLARMTFDRGKAA